MNILFSISFYSRFMLLDLFRSYLLSLYFLSERPDWDMLSPYSEENPTLSNYRLTSAIFDRYLDAYTVSCSGYEISVNLRLAWVTEISTFPPADDDDLDEDFLDAS